MSLVRTGQTSGSGVGIVPVDPITAAKILGVPKSGIRPYASPEEIAASDAGKAEREARERAAAAYNTPAAIAQRAADERERVAAENQKKLIADESSFQANLSKQNQAQNIHRAMSYNLFRGAVARSILTTPLGIPGLGLGGYQAKTLLGS